MHRLELPALLSDDPLGLLAALGVLELADAALPEPARLCWTGPSGPAVLVTEQPVTLDELVQLLAAALPEKPNEEPLPLAPGIVREATGREPGAPNEALRMPIAGAHRQLREYTAQERDIGDPRARWFTALVNQMSATPGKDTRTPGSSPAGQGALYTRTTPLFAAAGRMTLANNWTKAAEHCLKDPDQLRSALTGWKRVPGYTGANLDLRSTGDAHLTSDGKPSQQGVPGATWLALHGFAGFRLTAEGRNEASTAWNTTADLPALTWPVWSRPLPRPAITALLEHPSVRTANLANRTADLANLGVTAVYSSTRSRLANSYGPLLPARTLWP